MAKSHENSINAALAEVLLEYGQNWSIHAESVGHLLNDGGRPDIVVERPDGWPVVIEAEVGNHNQADIEAQSRLGMVLTTSVHSIHAVVAVVYPDSLRQYSGAQLRDALRNCRLDYALTRAVSKDSDSTIRFPQTGWISGTIMELALLIHRCSIPYWRVNELALVLERDISRAANASIKEFPIDSVFGRKIAQVFSQTDDAIGQTRRMALTTLVNALIFHTALHSVGLHVPANPSRQLLHPEELMSHGALQHTLVLDEWRLALDVNYWPIFHTAREVLRVLPVKFAGDLLDLLWKTAQQLISGGVTKSHDLTGIVFQRLIADRKFLATFYTMPSSASLLASLALPINSPIIEDSWADPGVLKSMRIGDFACGTGTLLSTAYQRISLLHQIHGGDPRQIHPAILEHGLVGLDVLTVAVHLTATMLAGTYPDTPFTGECLLTMPYGIHEWGVSLGSLDLLEGKLPLEIITAAAEVAGGRGSQMVATYAEQLGHGEFDLVIMNPPFTRHGAREGDRKGVRNPAFAAFEADEDEQKMLEKHMKHLARDCSGHGHAGMASYFVDLAHRKVRNGGTVALVLPLTALSGKSWENVRELWRSQYVQPTIVTIAENGTFNKSFSEDTGMAECLFVGKKASKLIRKDWRANFVILNSQPSDTVESEQIAQSISNIVERGEVRNLEDGPFGGTAISIGSTRCGEVVQANIPKTGPWPVVGIHDITLAQSAYQLSTGRLWIEGMASEETLNVPICTIGHLPCLVGPHTLDLTGPTSKNDDLPQGPFECIDGCTTGDSYPSLWRHNAKLERTLIVSPDSHLKLRNVKGSVPQELQDRAAQRWKHASRVHYNSSLRFNSQSTIVAMTERPSLGGPAWPTVTFDNNSFDALFTIWCNSALGLLCHWWMSSKVQSGRGIISRTALADVFTLNLSMMKPQALASAQSVLADLSGIRFLPFDQINDDPARAELDRRLLIDVLNFPECLCRQHGAMDRLREKLAMEPQVHADKKTKIVFTDQGEIATNR